MARKNKIERFLNRLGPIGKKISQYLRKKRSLFQPASGASFSYLDKLGRKRIDRVYEETFNELFILMKSLHLKGDFFEFGVFQGYSSLLLAKKIKQFDLRESKLHLFDSFIGLPEGKSIDCNSYEHVLGVWDTGAMRIIEGGEKQIQKKLERLLPSSRVSLSKGFFEETLESYISQQPGLKARLIHLDCDLYSASKFVLDALLKNEIIQDGTLLIFDDWMTSLGNPHLGQRKAVAEILAEYPMWSFEKYLNYGVGSHVFVAHDLRITDAHGSYLCR